MNTTKSKYCKVNEKYYTKYSIKERKNMKIAVIVGSLQKDSHNKKLAKTMESLMPKEVEFEYVDIHMPLFNQDLEAEYPAEAKAAKDIIMAADGILVVTPEYNRSLPGVLKNAIDWVSRPYGQNGFNGKPVGIMGASIGPVGTAVAQSDFRHVALFLNMKLMGQPEVYIANAGSLSYDENGILTDERWVKNLQAYADAFTAWVASNSQNG